MMCPKCDQTYEGTCECGYRPKEPKDKQLWLIQYCETPGCDVAIRVKIQEPLTHPICRRCQAGTAYNSRPRPAVHPGEGEPVSKEEFGLDLYEAIRLQSAMRQADKTADFYRCHGLAKDAQEFQDRATALQRQLKTILDKNTIEPADLQRLLAIT